MIKKLLVISKNIDDYNASQEVIDVDEDYGIYSVQNLCMCPEDAIIGRDLVSAYEAIRLIELGMKYAQQGYTDIEIVDNLEEDYNE